MIRHKGIFFYLMISIVNGTTKSSPLFIARIAKIV